MTSAKLSTCLVCLNSTEKNIFVTTEISQKIFNVCCSRIKDAINVEFLIKHISEKNSQLSFCKNCLESSLNLSKLVEQLSNLKKQIVDLTQNFSEFISQRRNEAVDIQSSQQSDVNTSSLQESIERNSERHQHFGHVNETVKCELTDEVPENEDLFTNLFVGDAEEFNLNSEDNIKNTTDPLGVLNAGFNYRNDLRCIPQRIHSSKSGLRTYGRSPNIALTRGHPGTDISSTSSASSVYVESLTPTLSNNDGSSTSMEGAHVDNSTFQNPPQIIFIKTDSKPHVCTICSKKFRNPSLLKNHTRIHTGEKPFLCSICPKSFSDVSAFKRHQRTHTGEKPHKCSHCDKSFIQAFDLRIHERRIHTGIKPFQCSHCDTAFPSNYQKILHERSNHKEDSSQQ